MKILFMGTPDIAAQCLAALLQTQHTICGVYTREDKPVGRKQVLTAPPVKQLAQQHEIPVYQPRTLKDAQVQKQIETLQPDIIVVVAYGRILPPEVLCIPKFGAINLHVSLLPKYRGAAPVQWSVIHGDTQTGVTIMQMDAGLDTGDIICTQHITIAPDMTSGELFEQVSEVGAKLLCKTIDEIQSGTITKTPQKQEGASWAPPIKKEMAQFDFSKSGQELHNLIRGMNPWPIAYFMYDNKKIKVKCTVLDLQAKGEVGEILSIQPLTIACAEGALTLTEVVPEGSRSMQGSAWASGRRFQIGDKL